MRSSSLEKLRRDKSGAALITVMCVMALILALSLSLLYGVAQTARNAEGHLGQVKTSELARSVSETLRDTLIAPDGSMNPSSEASDLKNMVQYFLTSGSYAPLHWYVTDLDATELPEGCTGVSVSLEKSAIEVPPQFDVSNPGWIDQSSNKYFGYLDLRVTVESGESSATVVYHYECQPDFSKISYFVGDVLSEVIHSAEWYLMKNNNEPIQIGVDDKNDPIYLTDATLIGSTGDVRGNEGIKLYSGFTSERVPYKLTWRGEV